MMKNQQIFIKRIIMAFFNRITLASSTRFKKQMGVIMNLCPFQRHFAHIISQRRRTQLLSRAMLGERADAATISPLRSAMRFENVVRVFAY